MELPSSEIEYWREYYSIFPFPLERQEIQTALICSTIANASGRRKKASKIEDYLPNYLGKKKTRGNSKEEFKAQILKFRKEGYT